MAMDIHQEHHKQYLERRNAKNRTAAPLRRTRGNSSDGLELVDAVIGCLFLVKWLVTKKWFWIGLGIYLLYAGSVTVLQANIGY